MQAMTAEDASPATFEEYAAARGAALLRFATLLTGGRCRGGGRGAAATPDAATTGSCDSGDRNRPEGSAFRRGLGGDARLGPVCLLQFRVTGLRPGWRQVSCTMMFLSGPRKNPVTRTEWRTENESSVGVRAGLPLDRGVSVPDVTVNGSDAEWLGPPPGPPPGPSVRPSLPPRAWGLLFPDLHGASVMISAATKDDALGVARSLIVADDPNRSETWPR